MTCFALSKVKSGTIFDNFLITDDEEYAKEFGDETWGETKGPEKKMKEKVRKWGALLPSLTCSTHKWRPR